MKLTREEQKRLSEERIINVSINEFIKHGYSLTKLDNIAKEADVAIGLIGHKFKDKLGLFTTITNKIYQSIYNSYLDISSDLSPLTYLNEIINKIKNEISSNKYEYSFLNAMNNSLDTPLVYYEISNQFFNNSALKRKLVEGIENNNFINIDINNFNKIFYSTILLILLNDKKNNLSFTSNDNLIKLFIREH